MSNNPSSPSSTAAPTSCRRCSTSPAPHLIRSEPLCTPCLHRYITTKTSKRLEILRVRSTRTPHSHSHSAPALAPAPAQTPQPLSQINGDPTATAAAAAASPTQPRPGTRDPKPSPLAHTPNYAPKKRALLPLSFGPSSLALLYILTTLSAAQRQRTGTSGFSLQILHLRFDAPVNCSPDAALHARRVAWVEERCRGEEGWGFWGRELVAEWKREEERGGQVEGLEEYLAGIPDASRRLDAYQDFTTSVIERFARAQGCDIILWGDSTTKVAERVLGLTAKGRGKEVPRLMSEDVGEGGFCANVRPLREVLRGEIEGFVRTVDGLGEVVDWGEGERGDDGVMGKGRTIDGLMERYFEGTEREYPSIVANVVRTAGRLREPSGG